MAVLFDFGETLVERVVDDVVPLSDHTVRPFPETVSTIENLAQRGFNLAIVSNTSLSTEEDMRSALRSINVEDHFEAVVTSLDVGHRKPKPGVFQRALELLGCPPDRAIMVGNDPEADIAGAAALGITTVLVDRGSIGGLPNDVVPDFTVASLAELPDILCGPRFLP